MFSRHPSLPSCSWVSFIRMLLLLQVNAGLDGQKNIEFGRGLGLAKGSQSPGYVRGIRVKNMTTACLGGRVGSMRSTASEGGHIGGSHRS